VKATARLQVIPIGEDVSVKRDISWVAEILQKCDFILETHASGTNIEGSLEGFSPQLVKYIRCCT